MRVVKLNKVQQSIVLRAMERAVDQNEDVRLAYDPLDRGIKIKIGNGVWSLPFVTEEM